MDEPYFKIKHQLELQGTSCMEIEEVTANRHQIIRTRSFAHEITDIDALRAALTHHVTDAAKELREQGSVAHSMHLFIQTNRFNPDGAYYYGSDSVNIEVGTSELLQKALNGVYKAGVAYKKWVVLNRPQHSDSSTRSTRVIPISDKNS